MPKTRVAYWKQKFKVNQERDAASISALEEMGWQIMVIWECEISTNTLDSLLNRLEGFLAEK